MKRLAVFLLGFTAVNCTYDDTAFEAYPENAFLIKGKTYALKHYRIESRIDLNEDHLLWIDTLESGQSGLISDLFFDDTMFFGYPTPSRGTITMSDDIGDFLCLE